MSQDFTFGVEYSPPTASSNEPPLKADNARVEYVYVYWLDLANTRRCRILPVAYFRQLMESNRPGVGLGNVGFVMCYLNIPDGFSAVGEFLYRLDDRSFSHLYGITGREGEHSGAILGNLEEKVPINGSVESAICPRTALARIVKDAEDTCAASFLVGFESEFVLLQSSTGDARGTNTEHWSTTAGMRAGRVETAIMLEIGDALTKSGIPLQLIHKEAAPGQFEVVTAPLPPMQAADKLFYTREIIANVSAKHGMHATFAPRPILAFGVGSSTHTHISVHSSAPQGLKTGENISAYEKSFLAGILDHLPTIAAITLPVPTSYDRLKDGNWSGGTWVSYGIENREAPVRICNILAPQSRNYELRFIDGAANMYLALAVILGAGLNAMKQGQDLVMKSCDAVPAALMSETEREKQGVTKRLPKGVAEGRQSLKYNSVIRKVLGDEMVKTFLSVSENMEKSLEVPGESPEDRQTRLVEFF